MSSSPGAVRSSQKNSSRASRSLISRSSMAVRVRIRLDAKGAPRRHLAANLDFRNQSHGEARNHASRSDAAPPLGGADSAWFGTQEAGLAQDLRAARGDRALPRQGRREAQAAASG